VEGDERVSLPLRASFDHFPLGDPQANYLTNIRLSFAHVASQGILSLRAISGAVPATRSPAFLNRIFAETNPTTPTREFRAKYLFISVPLGIR